MFVIAVLYYLLQNLSSQLVNYMYRNNVIGIDLTERKGVLTQFRGRR